MKFIILVNNLFLFYINLKILSHRVITYLHLLLTDINYYLFALLIWTA